MVDVARDIQTFRKRHLRRRHLSWDTALLYRELGRRRELGAPGRWPPVLPVVLYNGDAPWTAPLQMRDLIAPVPETLAECQPAQRSLVLDERRVPVDDLPLGNLMRGVVGFEQSRSPADLARVVVALADWLRSPADTELGRAFAAWLDQIVQRMAPGDDAPPLGATLEEAKMTLLDRVAQWPEQWRREGVAEGRREGVARERQLLSRLATVRFGSAVANELGVLIQRSEDWETLAAVAEMIVAAESGRAPTDQVGALIRSTG